MPNSVRPILKLATPNEKIESQRINVTTIDVLLPCRRFVIDYKVAVLGRVSLTAEFLLRLLKTADGMQEKDCANFLGFSQPELAFVLSEVEELGFVERRSAKLHLTIQGMSLFRVSATYPEIFEVEDRRDVVGFDLLSFSHEKGKFPDDFEFRLPELPIIDSEQAGSATSHIPGSFRRNFYRIQMSKSHKEAQNKQELYSIDRIEPEKRFSVPLRLILYTDSRNPGGANIDWSALGQDIDLEEKTEIMRSASEHLEKLKVPVQPDDQDAFKTLYDFAPEFLKDFKIRNTLNVDRYYRDILNRTGDIRSDRRTVPVLGSLFTQDNVKRLIDAIQYGVKNSTGRRSILWIPPVLPNWGATKVLPDLLKQIKLALSDETNDGNIESFCLTNLNTNYLKYAFTKITSNKIPYFPKSLELLVIPGIAVAVVVHSPLGTRFGIPLPLGFVSFDELIVKRLEDFLFSKVHEEEIICALNSSESDSTEVT